MTEQPADPQSNSLIRQRRMRAAYRLTVSLVTARDDLALRRQLVQEAADAMPQATYDEMVEVGRMFCATSLMLTSYIAGLARISGDDIDDRLRATIRPDLLDDL